MLDPIAQAYPLLVLQQAPYAGSLARAALDIAMSYAVFAQSPRLLFTGAGVLALIQAQDPAALGRKSLRKIIDSLPLYDVDEIYVDQWSMERSGLDGSLFPAFTRVLNTAELGVLRASASQIVSL